MAYNSPLGREKEHTLISLLTLSPESKAIEIGCGSGELLINIAKVHGANGLGIDLDPDLIQQANEHSKLVLAENQCIFIAKDIAELQIERESYDLVVCNGSSHALGYGEAAYENTLHLAYSILKNEGLFLLGEPYWKKQPEKEYMEFIGEPVGIYQDFLGNIRQAEKVGFGALYATSSSQDEWDHFEWSRKLATRAFLKHSPEQSEIKEKLSNINRWLNGYLKWGRDTMGYGFYLFEKL